MKAKDHLFMANTHVQQLWPSGVLINLWGPTGPKMVCTYITCRAGTTM